MVGLRPPPYPASRPQEIRPAAWPPYLPQGIIKLVILAWVRQGPRAQRTKQKDRFERYYEIAAQEGPVVEEDVELVIPPPPQPMSG